MFELTKKEFLRENGVGNGDTTKRDDVYLNLYRKMNKEGRDGPLQQGGKGILWFRKSYGLSGTHPLGAEMRITGRIPCKGQIT